ncbi:MAG: hypothetical protein FWE33_04470 [Defluviitaleaceae bacterium]|nr:hypothetical protein [Defluviitaleaceae bacterium]
MDVTTMVIFSGITDINNEIKEAKRQMTDVQFMAMVKMAYTAAENTRDIKDFKKVLVFPDNAVGNAFVNMLSRIVDNLSDIDKVRQLLKDILMMEGAN